MQTAISSLNRLTHRGAIATDGKTGDGCGLLIKMPRRFCERWPQEAKIRLAPLFAAGLVFLSRGCLPRRQEARRVLSERDRAREALSVAGFRVMSVDPSACGEEALRTLPHMEQLFVNAGVDMDEATFNRRLYMARRRAEKLLEASDPAFYIPSLSASTIVYKGMVMPQHLAEFYPDLKDPRMEASVVVFHQRFSTNTLPQWRLAHPYRYLAHNGEINTVQGNRSWAVARGPLFRSPLLPDSRRCAARGIAHRIGFPVARQHARAALDGRPRSHACDAHAGSAGLAVGGHDRSGPQGVLRVLRDAHGALGRAGRHRAHRRALCAAARSIATACVRRAG